MPAPISMPPAVPTITPPRTGPIGAPGTAEATLRQSEPTISVPAPKGSVPSSKPTGAPAPRPIDAVELLTGSAKVLDAVSKTTMPSDKEGVSKVASALMGSGQMLQIGALDLVRKSPTSIDVASKLTQQGTQVILTASMLPAAVKAGAGKPIGEILKLSGVIDTIKGAVEILSKPAATPTTSAPATPATTAPAAPQTTASGTPPMTAGYL